ncbi:MAG: hypothetical protein ACTSWX_00990 [Promethearchaeota archaeon]
MTEQEKKEPIKVFQLNDEKAEFEELELEPDVKLYEILNSKLILYFVDPSNYSSFIWAGSEASTRMKFIAANKASSIRDKIGPAIKISTVDESDETLPFKIMVGLEKEETYEEEQTGPAYEGTAEDDKLLKNLTLEKIVLLLEKIGLPDGYQREMVIDGNNIYGYLETYKEYLGQIIKERKLYRLKESVPDGPYLAKDLIPRILMSYNRVVLTELIRKMTPEEIEKKKENEKKIQEANEGTPFK